MRVASLYLEKFVTEWGRTKNYVPNGLQNLKGLRLGKDKDKDRRIK